jgi:hypothetical protein
MAFCRKALFKTAGLLPAVCIFVVLMTGPYVFTPVLIGQVVWLLG